MNEERDIPKGWAEAQLEDMLDYIQPTEYIVTSTEYDDEYKIPVLTAGKSFLLGYTNETFGIFNNLPAIIFDDFTTAIKWVNFPFKVKSSAMKILVPTHKDVNMKYVYYFMETLRINTDTHKRYWISVGAKINFPLPPLPEQHRIVAKIEELFSSLDKGIESLKTAQEQLKVYRQAVLKWAFEGKLTNNRLNCDSCDSYDPHDQQDAKTDSLEHRDHHKNHSNHKNHSSDNGELPEGWAWKLVDDFAHVIDPQPSHRTPPEVIGGVPYVSTKDCDYNTGKIDFNTARKVSEGVLVEHMNRYTLESGDFIIGKIGTIGQPIQIVLPQKYTLSANVVLIQPRKIHRKYLYYYFKSNLIEKEFKKGQNATAQAAFGIQKVRALPLKVAPLPEQHLIVSEIESRLSVCDKIEESISTALQQAEALRQSILKKAFEGKLVPQDPNDEPASVLLERIRAERELLRQNQGKYKKVKPSKKP